ncbi:hypothetical protein FB45DRAFT_1007219 [Roridomyces roridus]|uniref:Uncharacterized protein n=1 Tax=Roridomyces roridus TaxID=1738132 RepID=A0AAD7BFT7_9AGAR|nr:hypothetical protein FB45DRAFT_1007219 [Roridomyces roridus]
MNLTIDDADGTYWNFLGSAWNSVTPTNPCSACLAQPNPALAYNTTPFGMTAPPSLVVFPSKSSGVAVYIYGIDMCFSRTRALQSYINPGVHRCFNRSYHEYHVHCSLPPGPPPLTRRCGDRADPSIGGVEPFFNQPRERSEKSELTGIPPPSVPGPVISQKMEERRQLRENMHVQRQGQSGSSGDGDGLPPAYNRRIHMDTAYGTRSEVHWTWSAEKKSNYCQWVANIHFGLPLLIDTGKPAITCTPVQFKRPWQTGARMVNHENRRNAFAEMDTPNGRAPTPVCLAHVGVPTATLLKGARLHDSVDTVPYRGSCIDILQFYTGPYNEWVPKSKRRRRLPLVEREIRNSFRTMPLHGVPEPRCRVELMVRSGIK